MRVIVTFLLCILLSAATGNAAFAEKRVALVIGNSAYQNVPRLDNPRNDARLIGDTLRDLGFTLVGGGPQFDLDKAKFDSLIQDFGNQLAGTDVALFYYAGHGLQARGVNYLVPIAANPTKEADLDFQMVDVNLVLRQMESSGTKLNLVVLDACRNNPFGGRGLRAVDSGLAQMRAPEGTLISFATQPGAVAQDGADGNSPYTKALAQTIRAAGLGIFETINRVGLEVKRTTGGAQQPWFSSSPIDGNFFFAPVSATAAAPSAPAADELTWGFLKDTTDVASLRRFVTQFPSSRFREEAQTRIAALERPSAPAPSGNPQVQAALPAKPDAATKAPIDPQSVPNLKLRMTSSFTKSLDIGEDEFVKRVRDLSGSRIEVQNFYAGEIVPGLQALDAVSNGTVEMAWSAGQYYIGKDPAFQFLSYVPFGFDPPGHIAWRNQPDVALTVEQFLKKYNVVAMPCGATGTTIDFASRKAVNTPADLRGLKIRVGAIAGQIFAKAGAVPQAIAGGDIYPALEKGVIDATTWSDPYRMEKLGFQKLATNLYYPGSVDSGDVIDLFVSLTLWQQLSPASRQLFQRACSESASAQYARAITDNKSAIYRMAGSGAKFTPLPQDVRRSLLTNWEAIAGDISSQNATFRTLLNLANQKRDEMIAARLR